MYKNLLPMEKKLFIIYANKIGGVLTYGNADHIQKKSPAAAGKKTVLFPQGTGKCRPFCG
jgi:hypothetical protein